MQAIQAVIEAIYHFLWGDLVRIPLPGGSTLGLSLLVLILVPAGVYFTVRTRFLPFRLFPEMMRVTLENNKPHGLRVKIRLPLADQKAKVSKTV